MLILEFILLIGLILLEFTTLNYQALSNLGKGIVRTIMILPLLYIINININFYTILMFIIFIMILLADYIIASNFIVSMVVFLVVHIILGLLFIAVNPVCGLWQWVLFMIILAIGLTYFILIINPHLTFPFNLAMIVYLLAISFSLWRATCLLPDTKGIILTIGMAFFFLCDYQVAYTQFVNKFNGYQIMNHILYYFALIGLAYSTKF